MCADHVHSGNVWVELLKAGQQVMSIGRASHSLMFLQILPQQFQRHGIMIEKLLRGLGGEVTEMQKLFERALLGQKPGIYPVSQHRHQ